MKLSKKKKIISISVCLLVLIALGVSYGVYDSRQASEGTITSIFSQFMPQPYTTAHSFGTPQVFLRSGCSYIVATHISQNASHAASDYTNLIKKLEAAKWKVSEQNGGQVKVTKDSFAEPDMLAYIYNKAGNEHGVTLSFVQNFKEDCL